MDWSQWERGQVIICTENGETEKTDGWTAKYTLCNTVYACYIVKLSSALCRMMADISTSVCWFFSSNGFTCPSFVLFLSSFFCGQAKQWSVNVGANNQWN